MVIWFHFTQFAIFYSYPKWNWSYHKIHESGFDFNLWESQIRTETKIWVHLKDVPWAIVFWQYLLPRCTLTHWGRVTHICAGKLIIIGSDKACRLIGAKPLSEPMLDCCQLDPCEHISMKIYSKYSNFHWRICTWKCRLRNGAHLVSASVC